MKFLGRGVQGFDPHTWAKFAPPAAAICQLQNFSQNDNLRMYLLSTGTKCLVEAIPRDSLSGIGISIFDSQLMSKKSTWGKNIQGESLMETRRHLRSSSQTTNMTN